MVLGKLPVPGRPTILNNSRGRAYCTCSRCGWGLFGHFYSHLSFLSSFLLSLGDGPIQTEIRSQRAVKPKTTNQPFSFLSPSLWETAGYRLKHCLKAPLSPKQPTKQPTFLSPSVWETARYRLKYRLKGPSSPN